MGEDPKNYIYFQKIVEIAISSAIINFVNLKFCSKILGPRYVFDRIGLSQGYYFKKTASNKDINRVKIMNKKQA